MVVAAERFVKKQKSFCESRGVYSYGMGKSR